MQSNLTRICSHKTLCKHKRYSSDATQPCSMQLDWHFNELCKGLPQIRTPTNIDLHNRRYKCSSIWWPGRGTQVVLNLYAGRGLRRTRAQLLEFMFIKTDMEIVYRLSIWYRKNQKKKKHLMKPVWSRVPVEKLVKPFSIKQNRQIDK